MRLPVQLWSMDLTVQTTLLKYSAKSALAPRQDRTLPEYLASAIPGMPGRYCHGPH